jgi:hypothetical protein
MCIPSVCDSTCPFAFGFSLINLYLFGSPNFISLTILTKALIAVVFQKPVLPANRII